MKKLTLIIGTLVMILPVALFLEGCSEDDDPKPLAIIGIETDSGKTLDGSHITDVPVNATIVILFNKPVKSSSAGPNSISILSDSATIFPCTVKVRGDSLTLTPKSPMKLGSTYEISISSTLKAMDGASATERHFEFETYGRANAKPPQSASQVSYFPFSGNMKDEIGTHSPTASDIRDLTYTEDRFGFAGMAGDFNGSSSIVEIPQADLYMVRNFTMSLWMKANSAKNGQFVLGLAAWKGFQFEIAPDWSWVKLASQYSQAGNTSDAVDNLFLGTGITKDNGGWQGITFQKDVLPHDGGIGTVYFKDKWAHVVCTYNSSTKLTTMYINGEKVSQIDFNLWPQGDPKTTVTGLKFAGNMTGGGNKLALGFIQASNNRIIEDSWANPADTFSNHFHGQMDDVRFFKVALTDSEVIALYAAEKP